MSFLIQKSPDQCLFAAPRSLSQLITSFIGSQCQGIRPAPLFAWPFKRSFRTFGILLILSYCQRRLLLPFLLKLQYFLKRTYYNLCFAVIIQFSRYVFECPFQGPQNRTISNQLVSITCSERLSSFDVTLSPDSLERRWSSRRFSYGYLVTTSPQSPVNLPSSLTTLLPLALESSSYLPVSVCGTGTSEIHTAFLAIFHLRLRY